MKKEKILGEELILQIAKKQYTRNKVVLDFFKQPKKQTIIIPKIFIKYEKRRKTH